MEKKLMEMLDICAEFYIEHAVTGVGLDLKKGDFPDSFHKMKQFVDDNKDFLAEDYLCGEYAEEDHITFMFWGAFCTFHTLMRVCVCSSYWFQQTDQEPIDDSAFFSNTVLLLGGLDGYACEKLNLSRDDVKVREKVLDFYEQGLYKKKSYTQNRTSAHNKSKKNKKKSYTKKQKTSTSSTSSHVSTHTTHQSHNKRKQCLDAAEKRNKKWKSFGGGKRRRK